MYIIDKENNRIKKIEEKTFSELGFKERKHLQEWIANNPESLGEELLIIQKEFSGFFETNERLDLLALDKDGNIVVIENKLDDSGKDVTWQVMKYASYCASLTKEQIKKIFQKYLLSINEKTSAEEIISEFFDNKEYEEIILNQGTSQRIMMIAKEFRKEVTSTVLWLLNYKIRVQCFKVTPYALNEQLFLTLEQILPIKEAEQYTVGMAEKAQDGISSQESSKLSNKKRFKFWGQFLNFINNKNKLFSNVSPSEDNWIRIGIGITGVNLNLVVSGKYVRTEIYINKGDKDINKKVYDYFYTMKDKIEDKFGTNLIWERMNDNVTSRIKYQIDNLSVYNEDNWEKMNKFLLEYVVKMDLAFRELAPKVNGHLKDVNA